MSLFNRYTEPGPGIPKNAPVSKGFALFWELLTRDFWSLLALNMLYSIICIPIITIGPASIAFCKVSCNMMKGVHVFPFADFWAAFKANFKRGILLSFVLILVVVDLFIVSMTILTSGLVGIPLVIITAFGFFLSFLIVSVCIYLIPLLGFTDLGATDLVKNAFFLAFLGKWNTLWATVLIMAIYVAVVHFYPISAMVMIIVGFVFVFLIESFFTWPIIEKNMSPEEGDEGDEEPFEN